MTWLYESKEYNETPEEYQGFVYEITELRTGKKYLGKKNFWRPKTLPKNSKRSRRVKTRVESDWRTYYGSNAELKQLVEEQRVQFEMVEGRNGRMVAGNIVLLDSSQGEAAE